MVDRTHPSDVAEECQVFCRYLCHRPAPAEVIAAYRRAHQCGVVSIEPAWPPIDAALLAIARRSPAFTRAADAYAVTFAKSSLLRRKLVLLLAILESSGSTIGAVDTVVPGPRVKWFLGIVLNVAVFAGALGLAAAALIPLRIWYRFALRPSS
jgi:hypothetical protein